MAGILVNRWGLSCASIQPCATGISDSRFVNNELVWSLEKRETVGYRNEFRPLRSVACIDVQLPITKLLKVRRTKTVVVKAPESGLLISNSRQTDFPSPLLDTASSSPGDSSDGSSSSEDGASDVERISDLEVDESVLEFETLGIINTADEVTEVPSNVCLVGIDPDVSGAIAVLKTASNITQAEVLDVPFVKVQIGKTMRRRHDARSIVDLLKQINAPEGSVAYVEQAMPFPKDGKQGWYGTGFGYGVWVGVLMASGYKVVPVRAQAWKSAMGISGREYTKDDSRAVAMSLFPDLSPQLKRKKDHGRADALLIAAFGRGMLPTTDIS